MNVYYLSFIESNIFQEKFKESSETCKEEVEPEEGRTDGGVCTD